MKMHQLTSYLDITATGSYLISPLDDLFHLPPETLKAFSYDCIALKYSLCTTCISLSGVLFSSMILKFSQNDIILYTEKMALFACLHFYYFVIHSF